MVIGLEANEMSREKITSFEIKTCIIKTIKQIRIVKWRSCFPFDVDSVAT